MPPPLRAKFYNQIYYPTRQLFLQLASHPYALEPESNALLHQLESLVLHANHFAEKNGIALEFDEQFRDLANSIKHIRRNEDEQVNIQTAAMFESKENRFRFIRNAVLAKYQTSGIEFDAAEKLAAAIHNYLSLVGIRVELEIPESNYSFHDWALTYYKGELSAVTQSARIIIVKKESGNYARFTPENVRYVVLDERLIGTDPQPHFSLGQGEANSV